MHTSTSWHQCGNDAGLPRVLNFSLWETLEWNAKLEQRKMTPSNMFNSELLLLLLLFITEWSWRCIQVKRSWLRDVNTKHMPWRWKDMQRQHFIIHFQDDLELPPTNVQKIIPKEYLCSSSRYGALSPHTHHPPGLQANRCKHPLCLSLPLSLCLHLSIPQSNILHWDSHVEDHSAFHHNHTRLLSNYFWSQPSWPGHCLSAMAWEFIGQNSDRWEGGHFFFMCNAALPAYMPPWRCLHDGSMLILINT